MEKRLLMRRAYAVLLASIIVVALSTLAIDVGFTTFAFGGVGFGTVYAQTIIWTSFGLARLAQRTLDPSAVIVKTLEVVISTGIYSLFAISIYFLSRRRTAAVIVFLALYLVALLVFPQATF